MLKKVSILIALFVILLSSAGKVLATDYYVDATNGNDGNLGTSTGQAWQTISKVNGSSFSPGDNIYFKRGGVWREQLTIPSSGTAGSPVTFGAYGTGSNPLIRRTQTFSDWYEDSLMTNGGFERYVGTPDDGVSDTFTGWANLVDNTNIIEATSSAYFGNSAVTITKNYAAVSLAGIRRNITGLTAGTTYYLEFYGKMDSGNSQCRVSIKDNENSKWLYEDGSWATNTDDEGIYPSSLRVTESAWTEKSKSFTTLAGNTSLRFDFTIRYDKLGVCSWDGIYLVAGSSTHNTTRIWVGYDSSVLGRFGLLSNDSRVPIDSTSASPLSISADGYFYKPTYDSYFYYRNDAGNPGSLEVGARHYGIYMTGKLYVTVDGIDVDGPGDTSGYGIDIAGSSSNITIRNLTISNTESVGIDDTTAASNITYSNITIYGSGNTGIYMNSSGGSVLNSKSYNNCRVVTDTGDCGGIGSYQGSGLTISGNEVYHNGLDTIDDDFEISVVSPVNAYTITNNYVHDCIQGCLQFTAGGNGSTIAYNIIDGFGTSTYLGGSWGHFAGIRIGHSAGASANTLIANNVIANGSNTGSGAQIAGSGVAIINVASTGTIVKNNIFYKNAGPDIAVNSNVTNPGAIFNNNDFYRTDYTNAWQWKGTNYSTLADWQTASGQDANSLTVDPLFLDIANKSYRLKYSSGLINAGTNVFLTSDYAGTPVPQGSAPDMGVYEYILPSPSALTQSAVADRSYQFTFTMSSYDPSDSLMPQIEIEPVGINFTNVANYTGAGIPYSGSAVTGTVNVANMGSGKFHWQARVVNSVGNSLWVSYGGNAESEADFSIEYPAAAPSSCKDAVPESAPALYDAIWESSNSVRIYFDDAKDPVEKYVLEYGTFSGKYQYGAQNIGGKGAKTYLVEGLSPSSNYYFRIRASNGCATGPWSNEILARAELTALVVVEPTPSVNVNAPKSELPVNKITPKAAIRIKISIAEVMGTVSKFFKNAGSAVGSFASNVFEYSRAVASLGLKTIAQGVKKPKDIANRFGEWILYSEISFREIVLDKEPTKILDVKVETLTSTSAVIYWKTNHLSNSKVNFGETLDYGRTVQSDGKVYEHRVEITDLKPYVKYFYEVMSQDKNYVYDANHEFTTPRL